MEIKKHFFSAADQQFAFLKRYNFKPKAKKVEAGTFLRVFQNDTTAIEIALEYLEQYLYVELCQLVDGKIKENPPVIRQESKLYCFNLENLLVLKAPSLVAKPDRYRELTFEQVEETLRIYSHAVETYASDVLQGDFKVFKQLDGLVKQRAAFSSQDYARK